MDDSALSPAERRLLGELSERGVRFMIVGMTAALMQGARGATEDIDLWFADLSDAQIAECVKTAGGVWVSASFGMGPPRIGGHALGDRFHVVTHMSGLEDFDEESQHVVTYDIEGLRLPVLDVRRILVSKRAAGRAKDKAAIEAIEDAVALLDSGEAPVR